MSADTERKALSRAKSHDRGSKDPVREDLAKLPSDDKLDLKTAFLQQRLRAYHLLQLYE
jgi:hypothetical protein